MAIMVRNVGQGKNGNNDCPWYYWSLSSGLYMVTMVIMVLNGNTGHDGHHGRMVGMVMNGSTWRVGGLSK